MTTYTQNCYQLLQGTSANVFVRLNHLILQWFRAQALKARINRERQQLLALPETMLRDMGITRAQAEDEARRIDLPEARMIALAMKKC